MPRRFFPRFLFALIVAALAPAEAEIAYRGVSLAGAEFGSSGTGSNGLPIPILPGVYDVDYTYPTQTEVDYYLGKGMNTFRLPFLWERLEPDLGTGALDATQLGYITDFVDQTTAKGGYVILDPHNFGQYTIGETGYAIGSAEVRVAQYADFWGQLSGVFRGNDHVMFGLMNEPAGTPLITTDAWFQAAQAAVDAIRDPLRGNAHNTILVPGNYYTGAWSWVSGAGLGTPNADVMGFIDDPAGNFLYEVHQYLDENYSGTSPDIDHDPVATLTAFTEWLQLTGNRAFLGEFAVAEGAIQEAAVTAMLDFLQQPENAEVWEGWTWWAGGPWWDTGGENYMFNLDPVDGVDAPQMAYLAPFLPVPEPGVGALLGLGGLMLLASSIRRPEVPRRRRLPPRRSIFPSPSARRPCCPR